MLENLNWWAILAGAVASMVIGAVWYSPMLFAKQWMELVGMKKVEKMGSGTAYFGVAVVALVLSLSMAMMIQALGTSDMLEGAKVGVLIWVGFVATTSASDYLFAKRPFKLYWINNLYYLVQLAVIGAILASWPV